PPGGRAGRACRRQGDRRVPRRPGRAPARAVPLVERLRRLDQPPRAGPHRRLPRRACGASARLRAGPQRRRCPRDGPRPRRRAGRLPPLAALLPARRGLEFRVARRGVRPPPNRSHRADGFYQLKEVEVMSDIAVAAVLAGAIVLASTVSVEVGISVALIELLLGVTLGSALSVDVPSWRSFIRSFRRDVA